MDGWFRGRVIVAIGKVTRRGRLQSLGVAATGNLGQDSTSKAMRRLDTPTLTAASKAIDYVDTCRYTMCMLFAWDPDKREINRVRHKLDLLDGQILFDGRPVVTFPSPRDGEMRFVSIGQIGARQSV
jgi:hypothetical protein